jgi:hypothetical protein
MSVRHWPLEAPAPAEEVLVVAVEQAAAVEVEALAVRQQVRREQPQALPVRRLGQQGRLRDRWGMPRATQPAA